MCYSTMQYVYQKTKETIKKEFWSVNPKKTTGWIECDVMVNMPIWD